MQRNNPAGSIMSSVEKPEDAVVPPTPVKSPSPAPFKTPPLSPLKTSPPPPGKSSPQRVITSEAPKPKRKSPAATIPLGETTQKKPSPQAAARKVHSDDSASRPVVLGDTDSDDSVVPPAKKRKLTGSVVDSSSTSTPPSRQRTRSTRQSNKTKPLSSNKSGTNHLKVKPPETAADIEYDAESKGNINRADADKDINNVIEGDIDVEDEEQSISDETDVEEEVRSISAEAGSGDQGDLPPPTFTVDIPERFKHEPEDLASWRDTGALSRIGELILKACYDNDPTKVGDPEIKAWIDETDADLEAEGDEDDRVTQAQQNMVDSAQQFMQIDLDTIQEMCTFYKVNPEDAQRFDFEFTIPGMRRPLKIYQIYGPYWVLRTETLPIKRPDSIEIPTAGFVTVADTPGFGKSAQFALVVFTTALLSAA